MTEMIKAIETRYSGYRFRSRTEARWAVFFNAAGIVFEYEPQGYELGDMKYLPDFYLPTLHKFVEVKGKDKFDFSCYRHPGFTVPRRLDEEQEKCRRLCIGTGKQVWIVYGSPAQAGCLAFVPDLEMPIRGFVNAISFRLKPELFNDACDRAASARFEHGEIP